MHARSIFTKIFSKLNVFYLIMVGFSGTLFYLHFLYNNLFLFFLLSVFLVVIFNHYMDLKSYFMFIAFIKFSDILKAFIYACFLLFIRINDGFALLYIFDFLLFLAALLSINNKHLNFFIGFLFILFAVLYVALIIYNVHIISNNSIFILDIFLVWSSLFVIFWKLSNKTFLFISLVILSVIIVLSLADIAFASGGGNIDNKIITTTKKNVSPPIIYDDGLLPTKKLTGLYGHSNTPLNAPFEIPHVNYMTDTIKPGNFITATSNYARDQNFYVLNPKSTCNFTIEDLAYKFKDKSRNVLIVMAKNQNNNSLNWFYLIIKQDSVEFYKMEDTIASIIDDEFGNSKLGHWSNMQSFDKNNPAFGISSGDTVIFDEFGNVCDLFELKYKLFMSLNKYRRSMHGGYPGMQLGVFFQADNAFSFFDLLARRTDIYVKTHLPPVNQVTNQRVAFLSRCSEVLAFNNNCSKVAMNNFAHILKKFK